jgi:hypothetical protein
MMNNLEELLLNLVKTIRNIQLNIVYGNHIKITVLLQPYMKKITNFIFQVCLTEE